MITLPFLPHRNLTKSSGNAGMKFRPNMQARPTYIYAFNITALGDLNEYVIHDHNIFFLEKLVQYQLVF